MLKLARRRIGRKRRAEPQNEVPTETPAKETPKSMLLENGEFRSVLDHPFSKWNDIEDAVALDVPEWSPTQRGYIVSQLIRFLELKVVLNESIPRHLLAPSPLVDRAWRALILETLLYKRVTCAIQDFHGRNRRMIHYTLMKDDRASEDRIRRTQSLFECYYGEAMPNSLFDVDAESLGEASTLTDANGGWKLPECTATVGTGCTRGIGKTKDYKQKDGMCLSIFKTALFGEEEEIVSAEDDTTTSIVTPDNLSSEGIEVLNMPPPKN